MRCLKPAQAVAGAVFLFVCFVEPSSAHPYPFPEELPPAESFPSHSHVAPLLKAEKLRQEAAQVLRLEVYWPRGGSPTLHAMEIESSGTSAFTKAARWEDPHGSFKGQLIDPNTAQPVSFSSIGTGVAFRYLVPTLTFRFPLPEKPMLFRLWAEHETTGAMELVLDKTIDPAQAVLSPVHPNLEVRLIKEASASDKLVVNIYAEGYSEGRKKQFFTDAQKVASTLKRYAFPGLEHFELRAVFAPSAVTLGEAKDLGLPAPVRDSFLSLYFPYWYKFGRYDYVIYPTDESTYRRSIGSVPYDYPFVLVDDEEYWGVGNFKELTAIPAGSYQFSYLLLHEFGHFFGLNEEYDSGGPTELAFAPEIQEPWSQNITFQDERTAIKWHSLIAPSLEVPTPDNKWRQGVIGAFRGGYAETPKPAGVYKPGLGCTMNMATKFCAVCQDALRERVQRDLGKAKL